MIEQAVDIISVGTCRGRRHAQEKFWLKVFQNVAIATRSHSMGLIDHNIVVLARIEFMSMLREGSHHREPTRFGAKSRVFPVNTVCEAIPQDTPVAFSRRSQNPLAMCYEKNFAGPRLANIEHGKISLSRTRGGNEQSAWLSQFMLDPQCFEGSLLHGVRHDLIRDGEGDSDLLVSAAKALSRFACFATSEESSSR